ncbi:hypothetical protein HYH03_002754 [Edaphochlamys debaryana]|uniref:Apple domain-containing protein n=1 Tax=Edaphochlamys debaryana TaxID=47281 RepID=A0A835YAM7_9CHLO|nr:hypothetical protein HYH03_002754 [Edaphochlamys debaryana]|eukprot:KAG2499173.1 hypothetical protein HYH03_002754 [Edaphochlamys debaryana]
MAPSSALLLPLRLPALALAALLLCCAGCTSADSPPASLIAVAARDVEGGIVSEGDALYLPNVTACRDACASAPGCNLWIYCAAADGCMGSPGDYQRDLRKYRQCWLKYDKPTNRSAWPRSKGTKDQYTGWISGTTAAGVRDGSLPDVGYTRCYCSSSYIQNGYKFKGVCAKSSSGYGVSCYLEGSCNNPPQNGEDWCPSVQQCTTILDTDLDGKVLNDGDNTYVNSPEECCGRCTQTEWCNAWTWCSDPNGCNGGELFRFRQCWLKNADPTNPQPKGGYGNSTGWISGLRMAWMPKD